MTGLRRHHHPPRFRSTAVLIGLMILCGLATATTTTFPPPVPPGEDLPNPGDPILMPGSNQMTYTPDNQTIGYAIAVEYRSTPLYGSAPMMVMFIADGFAESYTWNFGTPSGYESTEPTHWYEYQEPGTYIATLTTVSGNISQNATIEIIVEPPGIVPILSETGNVEVW